MANILSDLENTDRNIPIFPNKQEDSSSYLERSERSIPKIYVNTEERIKKEGSLLIIGEEVRDISEESVLGFLNLLLEGGIEASFVNNDKYSSYPALCIRDFSNRETEEIDITNSPFDIESILPFKTCSIDVLSKPEVKNFIITDLYGTVRKGKIKGNFLILDEFFDSKFIYTKGVDEFIIKLGDVFTTNRKDVFGRYVESVKNTI